MNKDYLNYLIYTDYYRWRGVAPDRRLIKKTLKSKAANTQGFRFLYTFRNYQFSLGRLDLWGIVLRRIWARRYAKQSLKFGMDVPISIKIGKGFVIWHTNGIVMRAETVFGDNCQIFQQITIGKIRGNEPPAIIGNGVSIGAGAKLIGTVSIGNNVAVGANAVVTHPIPDNCSCKGVPARINENKDFKWARTDYLSFEEWKKEYGGK